MKCPHCGEVLPDETDNFCGMCGVALKIICGQCRTKNPAEDKFCGSCGKLLGSSDELTESSVDLLFRKIIVP